MLARKIETNTKMRGRGVVYMHTHILTVRFCASLILGPWGACELVTRGAGEEALMRAHHPEDSVMEQ